MKKIVDFDAWKEFVTDNTKNLLRENFYYAKGYEAALVDATELLVDMPNVEEKRGRWNIRSIDHLVYGKNDVDFYLECSQCGRTVKLINKNPTEYGSICREYPYCHCGAKMDLGEEK